MAKMFTLLNRKVFLALGCLLLVIVAAKPAYSQISHITPGKLKSETKKSKREAASFDVDHKETHLDLTSHNHKPGESGRKNKQIEEDPTGYEYDAEMDVIRNESGDRTKNKLFRKVKKNKS